MARENSARRNGFQKSVLALAVASAAPSLFGPHAAQAASFTWDNNPASLGAQDGAGTWNTSNTNFISGGVNTNWNNGNNDTAVFGSGANGGQITIGENVTIGGLTVNNNGYIFGLSTGGVGSINIAGTTPVSLSFNGNGTINAGMTGTGPVDFVIGPSSTLTTPGTNLGFTGGWALDGGGTLSLNAKALLNSGGTVTANSGTILLNDTGTLSGSLIVPTGSTVAIGSSGNASLSANTSGAGTIYLFSNTSGNIISLQGNNGTFTGTFRVGAPGKVSSLRFTNNAAGSASGTFDLQNNGTILTRTTSGTVSLGALMGTTGSALTGPSATGSIMFEIGAAGVDTTFGGLIANGSATAGRTTNINKVGNSKLTLSASNSYLGTTSINGGTLAFTHPQAASASPSITVNVGTYTFAGALDVSGVTGGYTIPAGQIIQGTGGTVYGTVNVTNPTGIVNPGVNGGSPAGGSLNFANTLNLNGGTVQLDLSNSTSSNDDVLNVNALSLTAPSKLFVSPIGGFTTGTYRLINYTSLPGGTASLSNLSFAAASGITAQLDTSTFGQINLNVLSLAPASTIHWAGPGTTWDAGASPNFALDSNNNSVAFFQGDNVTFNDTAGAPTSVSLVGSLQPSSLHFNNNTINYTLSGAGGISGGTGITKDGTGSVSIQTANSFTGPVVINAGTLRFSNSAGPGSNGTITLNGGTLGIDSAITLSQKIRVNNTATLSGNGTFSGQLFGDTQTLNFDIPSGSTISMRTTTVFLNPDDFTGTFNLGTSNGTLRWQDAAPVTSDIALDLGTGSATFNPRDDVDSINLSGIAGGPNTKLLGDSNTNTSMGYVIGLFGGSFVPAQTTFAGQIGNGVGGSSAVTRFTKQGANYRLILSGANTYTGTTDLENGTLEVDGTHSGGGTYTVNGGTLSGTGAISARIETGGGHIAPGSVANPTGALTVGTLNLSNSNLVFTFQNGGASKLNVTSPNGLINSGANVQINDLGGSSYGRYILIDYSGTPLADLSGFNPNSGFTVGTSTGNLVNNTFNTSVDLYLPNPAARDSTWSGASSRNWTPSATGNWTNGLVPGVADDFATFTDTGAGAVNVTTPATVAQIAFNTSTGSYTLSGSPITLDATGGYVNINALNGTQTISNNLVLNKQTYLGVDTPATLVLGGQISGSMPIVKSGAGTLVLNGNNTFSGPVTLSSGTLIANSGTAIGDGSSTNTLALGGGTLVVTGAFTSPATRSIQMLADSAIEHGANAVEIDGQISGGGKLTTNGASTTTLAGTNGFTGGLTVNNGTVIGLTPQAIGTGRVTLNNATLQVPGSQTYGNAITITGGGTLSFTSESQGTFSGAITDNGTNWTVVPGVTTAQTVNFTTNTVSTNPTGTLTLANSGTIRLIGTSGVFNMGSLTVNVGNSGGFLTNRDGGLGSVQLGGIAGGPNATLRSAGSSSGTTNWHIGYNNVDNTFSGTVSNGTSGNLALTKEGSAVLSLLGTLTYTGGTTVAAGGLKVNKLAPGTVAISAGTIQVLAKGTPNDITGTSVITAAPTIATGSTLDLTNNALIVDYTTLGTNLTDLRGEISGGKLISSTASNGLVLGYADAAAVNRTTFGGVTLPDNTAIVVGLTNRGDATMDGTVNALDFNAVATNFGTTGTGVWQQGDFNYDGNVDTSDFTFLSQNFGKTVSLPAPPVLGSLVPEPASIGAIAMLGLLGARRRRGK